MRACDGVQRDTKGIVNFIIQMGPAELNVEFPVLDINTRYNLLLGRSFIHMAGTVSFTIHQIMIFGWKDLEMVTNGEGFHSKGFALIVDEVSRGCIIYTVEMVNATVVIWLHSFLCLLYTRFNATVMIKNGFERGLWSRRNFQGVVEHIQIPSEGASFSLGYLSTGGEAEMKSKNIDQALARTIPHLYLSFPVRGYDYYDGLGEGIWGLLKKLMLL